MKPSFYNLCRMAMATLLFSSALAPIHAQPPETPAEVAMPDFNFEAPQWRALALANMAPSAMAALIDPVNHAPAPAWITSRPTADTAPDATKGTLAMYPDIAALVAVDSQKELLVLGKEQETTALARLLEQLDKTGAPVSFRVIVVAVENKAAQNSLGVRGLPAREDADGNPIAPPPAPPTPFIGGAAKSALEQTKVLEKSGKAVVLAEQSVVAQSRFAASMVLSQSAPRDFGVAELKDDTGSLGKLRDVSTLTISNSVGAGNSIALSLQNARHLMWLPNAISSANPRVSLQAHENAPMEINVQDGETIAIFGFADDAFPTDAKFTPEQTKSGIQSNIVMLIQANRTQ